MKIRLVGPKLFHAAGRTYMTKLIDFFRHIDKHQKRTVLSQEVMNEGEQLARMWEVRKVHQILA